MITVATCEIPEIVPEDIGSRTVQDCMSQKLVTITPDTTLETALRLMIDHDIHHIPVVEEEHSTKISGFLTSTDILRAYTHKMSEMSK